MNDHETTSASVDSVIVAQCCTCRRIRLDGHWLFVRDDLEKKADYSHTYCPACLKEAYANLGLFEVYAVESGFAPASGGRI